MNKRKQIHSLNDELLPKQIDIINLLLKFRHLNTHQIRNLLNHKAKERIRIWLNDLTNKGFIYRHYIDGFEKKPADYCLDTSSIALLKAKEDIDKSFLKRLYYEKEHSKEYREHCQFIATAYLSLLKFSKETNIILRFDTKSDIFGTKYLILPYPDAYFYIKEQSGEISRYFLEVFDNRAFIYKRVYQYFTYYNKNYWQHVTKTPFPEIIYVCPDEYTKNRVYRFIQGKLTNDSPKFYLTTREEIQKHGLNHEVLDKVVA